MSLQPVAKDHGHLVKDGLKTERDRRRRFQAERVTTEYMVAVAMHLGGRGREVVEGDAARDHVPGLADVTTETAVDLDQAAAIRNHVVTVAIVIHHHAGAGAMIANDEGRARVHLRRRM